MKKKKFLGHDYEKEIKIFGLLFFIMLLKSYNIKYVIYVFFAVIIIKIFLFIQKKWRQFYQSV